MMKRFTLVALVAALVFSSLATLALADEEVRTCTTDVEDGSGLPECGTRADNECYPGGTMAGKCDNEWLWKAGWEIARFNDGLLTREQVNPAWAFLLPPPIAPVPGDSGGGTCTIEVPSATTSLGLPTTTFTVSLSFINGATLSDGYLEWRSGPPGKPGEPTAWYILLNNPTNGYYVGLWVIKHGVGNWTVDVTSTDCPNPVAPTA